MASDLFDLWTSPDTTQDIIQLTSSDMDGGSSLKIPFVHQNPTTITSSIHGMGLLGEILNENPFPHYTPSSQSHSHPHHPHAHDMYSSLILSSCQSAEPNMFWNDPPSTPSLDLQMNMETESTTISENEEIIVNVNHEPLVLPTSMTGMVAYGLDDIPTHGVSASLDEINLDDVFQGWGETMHHLLWKIVNPLVDINAPYIIDDEAVEKLRQSLNDTPPFTHHSYHHHHHHHVAYGNSNLVMPIQVSAKHARTMTMTTTDRHLPPSLSLPISKPIIVHSENARHLPRILSSSSKSKPKPMNNLLSQQASSQQSLLGNILLDNNNYSSILPSTNELSPPRLPNKFQNSTIIISNGNPDTKHVEPCSTEKFWERKCDICGLILLGGRQRFEAHVKNTHQLKCICGLDFKFKLKLMNHIKSMAAEAESQDQFSSDEPVKHGITPGDKIKPMFECDYCEGIFRNRNAAVKHRNLVHADLVEAYTKEVKVGRTSSSSVNSTKKVKIASAKESGRVRKKAEPKSKSKSQKSQKVSTTSEIKSEYGNGNSYDSRDSNIGGRETKSKKSSSAGKKGRSRKKSEPGRNSAKSAKLGLCIKESESVSSSSSAIQFVVPITSPTFNVNFNPKHGMCGGSISVINSVNGNFPAVHESSQNPESHLNRFQSPTVSSKISNSHNIFEATPTASHGATKTNMFVANINKLAVTSKPAKKPKKMSEAPRKRLKMPSKSRSNAQINMNDINALFMETKPAGWVHCSHFTHDSDLDHSFAL